MTSANTIIKLSEIRDYYKDYCTDEKKPFKEKEFEQFVDVCERDFFQWLKDNLNYFEIEQNKAA
jgi:hypothetical protein